jgi:lipopolysaccharide/colanic/teichoic acid biosynthesis glycosyltransferase
MLVPVSVVIMVCAIAIKLDSSGPVLYKQKRMGYQGVPFTIYKLRTMEDRSSAEHSHYTTANDARITGVGRYLRGYRLDELPQIFNILAGEMSWIGPRPEAISLAAWYESEIPFYNYRHMVRPGISGWAQVNQGNVAEPKFARIKLEYDFFYIKRLSFWLDFVIFVKTFGTIFSRFGAR